MIELTIDDLPASVPEGTSILEAARSVAIDIPTLCYERTLGVTGACRLCMVEIEGSAAPRAACATEVATGMVVHTESDLVVETRRTLLDLLLSDHPLDCLICEKAGACKLQEYCYRYGVEARRATRASASSLEIDEREPPHPARPEQVHPLRQVRAPSVKRSRSPTRSTSRRARLRRGRSPPRSTTRSASRSAASAASASTSAPPARSSTSSSRAPAPGTARRCAPPVRSAAWAATST